MLVGEGFKEVYNLSGGMMAWNGLVAEGPEELNLDMVRGDETPEEIVKLAYGMETALGDFYRAAQRDSEDAEVVEALSQLAAVEDKHKDYLLTLYATIAQSDLGKEELSRQLNARIMEGGFDSTNFLEKNKRFLRSVPELLDLSMMLETQALDLYLRFANKTDNDQTQQILHKIADEEKGHLQTLGHLRGERA